MSTGLAYTVVSVMRGGRPSLCRSHLDYEYAMWIRRFDGRVWRWRRVL